MLVHDSKTKIHDKLFAKYNQLEEQYIELWNNK